MYVYIIAKWIWLLKSQSTSSFCIFYLSINKRCVFYNTVILNQNKVYINVKLTLNQNHELEGNTMSTKINK